LWPLVLLIKDGMSEKQVKITRLRSMIILYLAYFSAKIFTCIY